jgi:hypothetical protein
VDEEGLHASRDIVRVLQSRFETVLLAGGPYVFADLGGVSPSEEQAAIDVRQIQPTGIGYAERPRMAT